MERLAAVFPGQGSQRRGMAKDFCDESTPARRVFEEASEALGFDVSVICHTEDPRLNLTEFTQPCILTAEIAMLEGLRERTGLSPERFGGHSLGEYTALVAAGAIPLSSAVRLVHRRGRLMQEAVPVGHGAMIAVVQPAGLDLAAIEKIAHECDVDIANLNSTGQVVLSGLEAGIAAAERALQPMAGLRAVRLEVSAPFHSRHMRGIEPAFREALLAESGRFQSERARAVTANVTGGFHQGTTEALIDALTRQISGTVRWIDNMRALAAGEPPPRILEIGPNRPLARFFKDLGVEVQSVISVRSLPKARGEA